jgi:hypothetical protein
MNGYWYPWGHKHASPSAWIAAWRHIVTVFRAQGVDDVTWLWTVNVIVKFNVRGWRLDTRAAATAFATGASRFGPLAD